MKLEASQMDRKDKFGVTQRGGQATARLVWPELGVWAAALAMLLLSAPVIGAEEEDAASSAPLTAKQSVPDWAADAIFYQIFPERFRNGDTSNDPTRESLEFVENVSDKWEVTRWTSDWYARAEWERERGDHFYDNGVFDRRYGGDLQGVLDKLDYLSDLGVNTLYFNPVFYARSLHKYDGNTYHHVDPHFGPDPKGDLLMMATETSDPDTWGMTKADKLFFKIVREAHKRGMRVVLDGVFNHTGRGFFAFENLIEKQADSPYKDWYIVNSYDDPETSESEFEYKGWWGVDTLPEFADNEAGDDLHPGPKQYIFDAMRRWMDPNGDGDPSDGIDGWRLDVAAEVPTGFWRDWNAHIRSINPEVYTVAEHWHDAAQFLKEGAFSATMNYHGFSWPVKGYLIDGTLSPTDAVNSLVERMEKYPVERRYALQNLVDSHDTDRIASMIVNRASERPYVNPERFDYDVDQRVSPRHWDGYSVRKPNAEERRIQRMVAVMQITFVGAPMFYYGTESGMWGADDPCDRMPMIWPDLRYDLQEADPWGRDRQASPVAFDSNLHQFYKAAINIRSRFDALRRGDFEVVETDDLAKGMAFKRSNELEAVYAIFNRGNQPWTVELPGKEVREVFTASGESHKIIVRRVGGVSKVTIPPLEAAVMYQRNAILASGR